MATQGYSPRPPKFVPAVGVRQIIALSHVPGRMVPSTFGNSEVVFDLADGRPWYMPQSIADEIYRMQVAPGDQIEVTGTGRKKTDVLIVPLQPRLTAASASSHAPAAPAGVSTASHEAQSRNGYHRTPPPAAPAAPPPPVPAPPPPPAPESARAAIAPLALQIAAKMCAIVDAMRQTKDYAQRTGIDLTNEDLRCIAATSLISVDRKGGY